MTHQNTKDEATNKTTKEKCNCANKNHQPIVGKMLTLVNSIFILIVLNAFVTVDGLRRLVNDQLKKTL